MLLKALEDLEKPSFKEIASENELADVIVQAVKAHDVSADNIYFGLRRPAEMLMKKAVGSDERFAESIKRLICEGKLDFYIRKSETLWLISGK